MILQLIGVGLRISHNYILIEDGFVCIDVNETIHIVVQPYDDEQDILWKIFGDVVLERRIEYDEVLTWRLHLILKYTICAKIWPKRKRPGKGESFVRNVCFRD